MAKTELRKLKEKADGLVKQIVRIRDEWTCQKCGKVILPEQSQIANTAHVIAKSQGNALRWDLLNVVLLCLSCHKRFHARGGGQLWFREKYAARWEYLNQDILVNGVIKPRPKHIRKYRVSDMKKLIVDLELKLEGLKNES